MNIRSLLGIFLSSWIACYHIEDAVGFEHPRSHRTMDMYQPEFNQMQRYRDTRSVHQPAPNLELLLHLPSAFRNVEQFKNYLGVHPEKTRTKREIRQEAKGEGKSLVPDSETVESVSLKVEDGDKSSGLNGKYIQQTDPEGTFSDKLSSRSYPETMIELPEPIRGPVYTTCTENFEDDPDDPRKRRNTSANDHDEAGQREKRTYMEGGEDNREGTTSQPYWKRKKEGQHSPPFITGGTGTGRGQTGQEYTPAQHRTENARESHSMKDKSVQSNEIPRSTQDNYYASSNRRAYNSRQAENFNTPTPKSVYDIYDYSNPRRNQENRAGYGRNNDQLVRDDQRVRQTYGQPTDFFVNGHPRNYGYGFPRVYYDRNNPYYYPYPGEAVGRGVEYYHRSIDPHSGRIIYYANMPDSIRSYDSSYNSGTFYTSGRNYFYDAYGRIIPYPADYKPTQVDPYARPYDNRYGRSFGGEAYANNADKYPRGARYDNKMDRYKDTNRNKTYVIFDADEKRTSYARAPYNPNIYDNRYLYQAPVIPPQPPIPQLPYPQFSPGGIPSHLYSGYYFQPQPSFVAPWHANPRPASVPDPVTYSPRPIAPVRSTPPTSSYDKIKKV